MVKKLVNQCIHVRLCQTASECITEPQWDGCFVRTVRAWPLRLSPSPSTCTAALAHACVHACEWVQQRRPLECAWVWAVAECSVEEKESNPYLTCVAVAQQRLCWTLCSHGFRFIAPARSSVRAAFHSPHHPAWSDPFFGSVSGSYNNLIRTSSEELN